MHEMVLYSPSPNPLPSKEREQFGLFTIPSTLNRELNNLVVTDLFKQSHLFEKSQFLLPNIQTRSKFPWYVHPYPVVETYQIEPVCRII